MQRFSSAVSFAECCTLLTLVLYLKKNAIMIVRIFLLFFLAITFTPVFSQTNWELTKEKNGIKVYTAKDASSKFKSLKVEAVFTGTLQKLINVLTDVGHIKDWVYGTKESYLIKKISASEIIYYSETNLPWPVSDRDIPIQMRLNMDAKNNTLKITATGMPNAIPEKKGIVRIPYFNAYWDVKYDGKNKLTISYILKMDPGGSVSPSVTNMFMTRAPYETFSNLSELVK